MEIINNVISHYSGGLMYDKEKRGDKSNALQWITSDDWIQIDTTGIKEIRVVDVDRSDENFTRKVTDISLGGNVSGYLLIVISWKAEK